MECVHENTIEENSITLCIQCGEELDKNIDNNKEWRYYGTNDNRHSRDPTRVIQRRTDERSIYKDVENMDFSEKVVNYANKLYLQVSKGQIFRGNSRKSLVFACIFHAYKMIGQPQTHESLIKVFNLTRKTGLKGLKFVNLNALKTTDLRTTISTIDIINDIMNKFSAQPHQKEEVYEIYNSIKNKSSKLNRSRPQSVASGVVYHWILIKNKDITLHDFAQKVELSELTITKIMEEIENIKNMPITQTE